MPDFVPDEARFKELAGKVVVLTGGATGIGAATVQRLHTAGAHVVFGDINRDAGEQLAAKLGDEVTFVPCDVTEYSDLYQLLKTAHDKHGRMDHAASIAGIFEQGKWFDPDLTIETVGQQQAPTSVIDINLMGMANFARIAIVFLRHGMQKGENKSFTFMSSVNAFRESPGLYMYQTSKHGTQGLMRAMRKPIYERDGIRVNCVCPGVTDTPMTEGIAVLFKQDGLYCQTPDDVARIVVGLQIRDDLNGKGIYVEGGKGFEFEEGFYREQPAWLGEEATRMMRANAEAVNSGALTRNR